jgi:hypothetical protein
VHFKDLLDPKFKILMLEFCIILQQWCGMNVVFYYRYFSGGRIFHTADDVNIVVIGICSFSDHYHAYTGWAGRDLRCWHGIAGGRRCTWLFVFQAGYWNARCAVQFIMCYLPITLAP